MTLLRKIALTTLTLGMMVGPLAAQDSFDGSMAIPMALFTGAGLIGSGNSTGVVYSFGEDGGDSYQSFGYDFHRPWQLWGRDTRVQAVWLAPWDWWTADSFNMKAEPNPALGLQLNHTLYKGHLIPGAPGTEPGIGLPGERNPPRLPTTLGFTLGMTFDLEHEELRAHIGLNLFRFLF